MLEEVARDRSPLQGLDRKRRSGKVLVIKLATFDKFYFQSVQFEDSQGKGGTNQTVKALEIDKIVERFTMVKLVA